MKHAQSSVAKRRISPEQMSRARSTPPAVIRSAFSKAPKVEANVKFEQEKSPEKEKSPVKKNEVITAEIETHEKQQFQERLFEGRGSIQREHKQMMKPTQLQDIPIENQRISLNEVRNSKKEQVVVTDYSLDVWLAQQFGIDLDKQIDHNNDFYRFIERNKKALPKIEAQNRSEKKDKTPPFVMSYPASLKVGPLETVHEDGSKSVQRLADKMYAEQENMNREIHAIKTKMGFKRDDLAYAEYYKSGASGKKQERKLSDFEEDYERKLSKFKENNKIGFKEAVICQRLSSKGISFQELQGSIVKHSRQQSLQPESMTIAEKTGQTKQSSSLPRKPVLTTQTDVEDSMTLTIPIRLAQLRNYQPKQARLKARIFSALPKKDQQTAAEALINIASIENRTGIHNQQQSIGRNQSSIPSTFGKSSEFHSLQNLGAHKRGNSIPHASSYAQQFIEKQTPSHAEIYRSVASSNDAARYASGNFSKNSSTMQRQELLRSIEEKLMPSKTLIKQTELQRQRLMQSFSRSQYGSRQLQIDLIKKGVTNNTTINISNECQQTLKEISFINEAIGPAQAVDDFRRQTMPPDLPRRLDQGETENQEKMHRESAWRVYDSRVQFMDKLGPAPATETSVIEPNKHTQREKSVSVKQVINSNFMQSQAQTAPETATRTRRGSLSVSGQSKKSMGSLMVRDPKKKHIYQRIQQELDVKISETPTTCPEAFRLWPPEYKLDAEDMRKKVAQMDNPQFWLQQGQKQENLENLDSACDFYRQGLRHNPQCLSLIYKLASALTRLGLIQNALMWFDFGCQLEPKWVDGLACKAMMSMMLEQKQNMLDYINQAKENYLQTEQKYLFMENKKNSQPHLISEERIIEIECIALRINEQYTLATEHYLAEKISELDGKQNREESHKSLVEGLNKDCKMDLMVYKSMRKRSVADVFGIILLLLSEDRKRTIDHLYGFRDLLLLQNEEKPKKVVVDLQLRKYCHYTKNDAEDEKFERRRIVKNDGSLNYSEPEGSAPTLEWARYEQCILKLLTTKSFFKRFSQEQLKSTMKNAAVDFYPKDAVVFKKGRIGVITSGQVMFCKHPNSAEGRPYIIKKAFEGDIIGFFDGDDGLSASPLTWYITFTDATEIVWLEPEKFKELWKMQQKMTEQQVVLKDLETNASFAALNPVTKYMLVFEHLEQHIYFPGEIIMSVSQRSPICKGYYSFFENRPTQFQQELENRKLDTKKALTMQQQEKLPSLPGKMAQAISLVLVKKQKKHTEDKIESREELDEMEDDDWGLQQAKEVLCDTYDETVPIKHALRSVMKQVDHVLLSVAGHVTSERLEVLIESAKKLNGDQRKSAISDVRAISNELRQADETLLGLVNSCLTNDSRKPEVSDEIMEKITKNMRTREDSEFETLVEQLNSALQKLQDNVVIQDVQIKIADLLQRLKGATELRSDKRYATQMLDELCSSVGQIKHAKLSKEVEALCCAIKDIDKELNDPRIVIEFVTVIQRLRCLAERWQNERIRLIKFLLHQFIENFKETQTVLMIPRLIETKFKQRKQLIIGIIMKIRNFVNELQINKKQGNQKNLIDVVKGNQSVNLIQTHIRGKFLLNLEDEQTTLRKQKTGIQHLLLIEQTQTLLQRIHEYFMHKQTSIFVEEYRTMMWEIMKEIKQLLNGWGHKRIEADGVHFIHQGQVVVLDDERIWCQQSKCDCFGLSPIVKQIGPEQFGDVRAGLRPVSTYFFKYEDIYKRLSYMEVGNLINLSQENKQLEVLISQFSASYKIEAEKLRRY